MTYCVGVLLESGMVFASDSRTNAGVDHVSSFRKMTVYERPGDRVIVILTSGNLSVTQNAINLLEQHSRRGEGTPSIWTAPSMYDVSAMLGECLREVKRRDGPYLTQHNIDASASFILGGQIGGEAMRLFLVYSPGNFIEATRETPYFQVGESKYGKPILDRVITPATPLDEAAKCALVSMDSTMRSNATVGPPIDILIYEKDSLSVRRHFVFQADDPYLIELKTAWDQKLKEAFSELHSFNWSEPERVAVNAD